MIKTSNSRAQKVNQFTRQLLASNLEKATDLIDTRLLLRQSITSVMMAALFIQILLPVPATAAVPLTPEQEFTKGMFQTPTMATGFAANQLAWVGSLISSFTGNFGFLASFGNSENASKIAESEASGKAIANRVNSIAAQTDSFKEMNVGQTIQLSALPLDENGAAVHGIVPEWSSSNKDVLKIEDGKVIAETNGKATLTVKAGAAEEKIKVRITPPIETTNDKGEEKEASEKSAEVKNSSTSVKGMEAPPMMLVQDENGTPSEPFEPENNPGTPYGQVEADSPNTATATRIRHRAGAANYSFSVPFASLPGRGLDASVGMTYNSRLWSKSPNSFTFDAGKSWLVPGFTVGYGSIRSHFWSKSVYINGSKTFNEVIPESITDPDGTRHQIGCRTWTTISGAQAVPNNPNANKYCSAYETTDGSFIKVEYHGDRTVTNAEDRSIYTYTYFVLNYPNGSKVTYNIPYSAYGPTDYNQDHYPVFIRDRNGNMIQVSYINNSDKIDFIRDTLNRYIRFYYDTTTEKNLIAVTVPGYGTGSNDRQTIRFYYEKNVALNYANQFSALNIFAPSTITTLKYVYFPATNAGYRYDYHTNFGMITKITQLRGMTVSTDSLTSTGSVTSEGSMAASTEYTFQNGNQFPLTDVPHYTQRTDDWAGRPSTVATPVTLYDAPEPSSGYDQVSTVTVQDTGFNVEYKTLAYNYDEYNTDYWKNGLIKETSVVKRVGTTPTQMSKTVYTWEQGAVTFGGRQNPILRSVEVTNDAGQISKTRYEYDNYNNQTVVEEYGFKLNGSYPTTPLKRTVTTYETGSNWINNNLLGLPKIIESYDNGVKASKTIVEYDGTALVGRSDMDLNTHDINYNPAYASSYVTYRGNATKVISLSDATKTDNTDDLKASVTTKTYDIAGNPVAAGLNCCQLKTWNYGATFSETGYAYAVEEKRGPNAEMTTSATYDKNTGLMKTATDENNQVTTNTYDPTTLRVTRTDYPNGGYSTVEYNDGAISSVKTKTRIDAIKESESWQFADGRGAAFRTRTRTPEGQYLSSDVEYDKLGRVKYTFNPYTAASADLSSTRPSNVPSTSVEQYDAFGRALQVKFQDNTIVENSYSGTVAVVTDQAGKKRRQIADALGRTVRVDEPNSSGQLDNNNINAPYQPTSYEYDGNDNLSKVTQTEGSVTQERVFVYDSLSRLLRERQPEMSATLLSDGSVTSPANTNWTNVYKYNAFGLLTEAVDARGVKSTLGYDTLNRLQTVVYSGEGAYKTPSVTYHYDEARNDANNNPYFNKNRMTKVETIPATNSDIPATVHVFDYDKMGNTVKQIQQVGSQSYTLKYGYNLAGQMVTEEYPTGKVVRTAVDSMGRTARVYDAKQNFVSGLQYAGNGQLTSMFLGNGTQEAYDYEQNRLQLKSQALVKGTQVLSRYDYAYGKVDLSTGAVDTTKNNGQLAKIDSYVGGTMTAPTKQYQQRFEYDSIGRISESREYRGTSNEIYTYKQHFDYDRFGNMYRKAANNATTGQESPLPYVAIEEGGQNPDINKATNRFTSTTGTVYDAAGNITKDIKFRSYDYAYDANNRMVKSQANNITAAPIALSTYDALGQRVATQIGDAWRFMVYDIAGQIVCEFTTEATSRPTNIQYLFADRQGSTRAITGSTGAVTGRSDYTAFGEEIGFGVGSRTIGQGYNGVSPTKNKYGLTERDEATGLDHTWFRKHENKSGKWTSPDPYKGSMSLGDPQSFNRYSYVGNQPTDFVDPSGLIRPTPAGCTPVYDDSNQFKYFHCTNTTVYGSTAFDGYTPKEHGAPGESGSGGETGNSQPEKKKDICKWFESFLSNPLISEFFQMRLNNQKDSRKEQGGLIGWFIDSPGADPLRTSFDNKNGDQRNLGKENTGEFLTWAQNIIGNIYPNANFSIFWHTHNNSLVPSEGDINVNNKLGTWGMIIKPGSASIFGREGEEVCRVDFPVS